MADATPNPFAALLPSPEGLDVQRRQQFLDLSQGQDYFSRVAGLSGLDFRKELINRGIGLTDEDRRAFNTQAILSRAQKSLSDMVKSGEMDPLSAQAEVIKRTMADFMGMGDYQAAQALLPGLNQIQTYQGEIAKVKSYTGAQDAAAYASNASGLKSLTDASSEASQLPGKIALTAAQTDTQRTTQGLQRAQTGLAGAQAGLAGANAINALAEAELRNRTDPNASKKAATLSPVEAERTYNTWQVAANQYLTAHQNAPFGSGAGGKYALRNAAKANLAPVLKQLFRAAGEGTFTDADQKLLLDMVPGAWVTDDVASSIMNNIDAIVRAKLGMPQQGAAAPTATGPNGQKLILQNGQWVPSGK